MDLFCADPNGEISYDFLFNLENQTKPSGKLLRIALRLCEAFGWIKVYICMHVPMCMYFV